MVKAVRVRRYRGPGYPDRKKVSANPELLAGRLPKSWLRDRKTAGAFAAVLAANLVAATAKPPLSPASPAVVAPLFLHGEGRGAVGCEVIAPPVFISEEEAISVIVEELARQGVKLSSRDVKMKDVLIPAREEVYNEKTQKSEIKPIPGQAAPLIVDGLDPKKKIAVEFVSGRDYEALGGPAPNSTVQSFDFPEVAQYVSKQVADQGKGLYFGAFYDPLPGSGDCWKEKYQGNRETCLAKMESKSKAQLRLQVKDFIDWLKAQGAI